jgi:hypothetical protein
MGNPQKSSSKAVFRVNEDWLAVIIALIIVLLATLGILGENSINISF